jgi:hypothetical protein
MRMYLENIREWIEDNGGYDHLLTLSRGDVDTTRHLNILNGVLHIYDYMYKRVPDFVSVDGSRWYRTLRPETFLRSTWGVYHDAQEDAATTMNELFEALESGGFVSGLFTREGVTP